MNKKVLLAKHEYSGIYKNIIWDLEANNFEVFPLLYYEKGDFIFKSKKDKLTNFIRKVFLNDKEFKKKLSKKYLEDDFLVKLKFFPANHFDYSFFIRADFFTLPIIKEIKRVSKNNFAYHWDGLNRFPKIKNLIDEFDDFYVFEEADYINYKNIHKNLKLTSNFYFEHNKPQNQYSYTDVFYIGEYIENRIGDLFDIYEVLKKMNLNIKILLWCQNEEVIKKYTNDDIKFFNNTIDYSEVLEMSRKSKIVIDVLAKGKLSTTSQDHNGLSLRFYEALHHKNKVISNNPDVIKHDLYNSNNIFIVGNDDFLGLEKFLSSPYVKCSNYIYGKYSFINWFNSKIEKYDI